LSDGDGITEPLRAALEQLERRLRGFGAPIVERLQPGLPPDAIDAILGRYGLAVPPELYALWSWHDGTDTRDYAGTQLVGGWHLLSVEQAADDHEFHRHVADEVGDGTSYPQGWFPVLLYVNGPFLAADCTARAARESPLYIVDGHADLPEDPPTPQLPSLRSLIEAFITFFELDLVERDEHRGGATVPWERIPEEFRFSGYW
jgi:hypothetical protein